MRKWQKIISIIASSFMVLLGLVMAFIEALALVTGEAALHEQPGLAIVLMTLRILSFLIYTYAGVNSFISRRQGSRFIPFSLSLDTAGLLVAALSFFHYEWYLALALLIFALAQGTVDVLWAKNTEDQSRAASPIS